MIARLSHGDGTVAVSVSSTKVSGFRVIDFAWFNDYPSGSICKFWL
jgi:hypothetical protein